MRSAFAQRFGGLRHKFLRRNVTVDDPWIHHYTPGKSQKVVFSRKTDFGEDKDCETGPKGDGHGLLSVRETIVIHSLKKRRIKS